jgi:CheY-like chemotaxis protein
MELIQPDLVITDMNMDGMSGLELIKRITHNGGKFAIPKVILYTAMLTPGLVAYSKVMGVVACLPKPFELVELKSMIKKILMAD